MPLKDLEDSRHRGLLVQYLDQVNNLFNFCELFGHPQYRHIVNV